MSRIRIVTVIACVTIIGASIAYFALEHVKHEARAIDAGVVEFKKGNYARALQMLGPYADRGNERVEFNVGMAYALGLGVGRDRERAHALLHRSMGSKALEMYLWIAKSFENGDGVAKDTAEAMAWYRIAADEGSSQARSRLEGEEISNDRIVGKFCRVNGRGDHFSWRVRRIWSLTRIAQMITSWPPDENRTDQSCFD